MSAGLFVLARSIGTAEAPSPLFERIDPRVVHEDGYVGSDVCKACHTQEHAAWQASYHRTMTQVASQQSVQAPFAGTELQLEGVSWRLSERQGDFWVSGREPQSTPGDTLFLDKRIVMTTGSHNYQLYWMQGDVGSEMAPFPLVYLLYDRVWIPRKSRFLSPPRERTANEVGRWSVHCIKCHATRGQPRHPLTGETRVAELGISCEACHGPGEPHARKQRATIRRRGTANSDAPDPSIVNPARLSHVRSTQVCGQCHSIEIFLSSERAEEWASAGSRYKPGDDLTMQQTTVAGRYEDNPPEVQRYLDEHASFRLHNCFWPDGTVRVAGREYHGILESPCYQRGDMSCLSCHEMHPSAEDARPLSDWADDQLGRGMRGDRSCLQCHATYSETQALEAHTHHEVASAGSRCQNCHMSYTSWGLLRAIRSHSIDSPSVATSQKTGRPNACNQCHLDRTMGWAAGKLQEWYDIEAPALSEDEQNIAASILWALSGDAVQRALMAWSMGWEPARQVSGPRWMVPFLGTLLVDPYDAVRFNAQRTLRLYPEYRVVTADSIMSATKQQQERMMEWILADWVRRFPATPDRSGPSILIGSDARMERQLFARLAALRRDLELVLFE